MPVHSKSSRVLVNEHSYSAKLNGIQLQWQRQMGESTAFADEGTKWVPGLVNASMTLEGRWESGTTVHDELNAAVGTDNGLLVTAGPDGLAVGKPVYLSVGDISNYEVPASVSEVVGFTCEAQGDDGADWGASLHDLTAETATGNGTSVDNAASSANGGVATLHVTAASGTTPSATVKVQHSSDDSVWVDLITFTAATTSTSERKTVTGTVNRYVRGQWTISGTSPSFTFVAAFARR